MLDDCRWNNEARTYFELQACYRYCLTKRPFFDRPFRHTFIIITIILSVIANFEELLAYIYVVICKHLRKQCFRKLWAGCVRRICLLLIRIRSHVREFKWLEPLTFIGAIDVTAVRSSALCAIRNNASVIIWTIIGEHLFRNRIGRVWPLVHYEWLSKYLFTVPIISLNNISVKKNMRNI